MLAADAFYDDSITATRTAADGFKDGPMDFFVTLRCPCFFKSFWPGKVPCYQQPTELDEIILCNFCV